MQQHDVDGWLAVSLISFRTRFLTGNSSQILQTILIPQRIATTNYIYRDIYMGNTLVFWISHFIIA
jgi:hypothetical protein